LHRVVVDYVDKPAVNRAASPNALSGGVAPNALTFDGMA
jgi:hypothetical protein